MMTPKRPVLRWHGGKWKLAPWILQHIPRHRAYVEPFGGAASVLVRKPPSYAEIYNDLDDEVVCLFRVLRDPIAAIRLAELLTLTPFARTEFKAAYEMIENDPVERARRLVIRSYMGFGSNAAQGHRSTGFRANSNRSGTTPAQDWRNYPAELTAVIERLRGVIVENQPAIEVMGKHDGPETAHYVDPPYLPETRAPSNKYDLRWRMYRHELTREDHRKLLEFLLTLEGMVILSGYPDRLYDDCLPTWRRIETVAFADGARKRTEVIWLNPQAVEKLEAAGSCIAQTSLLFAEAAE